jgi:peptide deformylase
MAVLEIITAPDPRLKVKAKPVSQVTPALARLMDDMLETMYAENGIGLAAPQVGRPERIIVVDIAEKDEERNPLAMANPEIVWASEEEAIVNEGCLSLPDQFAEVTRPAKVKIAYLDRNNERREIEADGMLACCVQHEIDHLDGKLFVDHISRLKRDMILRKLQKSKRLTG